MVKNAGKNHESDIKKLNSKVEELENNYKRAIADYKNLERRHHEQESVIIKMASATLIEKLLLNLDALKMAQHHLKDRGLQMVVDQFMETLSQEGLHLIESDHQDFDPLTMDCVEIIPGPKDKVIETVTEGFYLYEKVLRPAKVKVGSGE